jgi:hypothetical protein
MFKLMAISYSVTAIILMVAFGIDMPSLPNLPSLPIWAGIAALNVGVVAYQVATYFQKV